MHIHRKRQSDFEPALTHEAQTNAQDGRSPQRSMRYSVRRVGLACLGVLGTLGLLTLTACPANLENPDLVIAQTTGGAAVVDTVDLTCVTALFNQSCVAGCHNAVSLQGDLDLATPGFAARLVDVDATHKQAPGPCAPAKLIDSANPAMSWLLVKLQPLQGDGCGTLMPFGGAAISAAQMTCVTTFVNAEAAEHAGAGAGTAGASTAGAATAGASSGGSGGASAGSGGM
ncbi:MAG: hypothetical protein ABI488_08975 [Polyangiaceae bacterium]